MDTIKNLIPASQNIFEDPPLMMRHVRQLDPNGMATFPGLPLCSDGGQSKRPKLPVC